MFKLKIRHILILQLKDEFFDLSWYDCRKRQRSNRLYKHSLRQIQTDPGHALAERTKPGPSLQL
jgi:hypothetical protein